MSGTGLLSPIALETSLIASYDPGPSGLLLPNFSPFSTKSSRGGLSEALPSHDDGIFSRGLLSPPRSCDFDKTNADTRTWSSLPSPGSFVGRDRGYDSLVSSPRCDSLNDSDDNDEIRPSTGTRMWASPLRKEAVEDSQKCNDDVQKVTSEERNVASDRQEKAKEERERAESARKASKESAWKRPSDNSTQKSSASLPFCAESSHDTTAMFTPSDDDRGRAVRMHRRGRDRGSRELIGSSGLWRGEPAGKGWSGEAQNDTVGGEDRNRGAQGEKDRPALTPSNTVYDGGRSGPHRPHHTTPSSARASTDETFTAAASLVSFHRPRANDAPRLKGPLGTNALRVTLGKPVVEPGTSSIGSSVQAKLSLPRTSRTPSVLSPSANGNSTAEEAGKSRINRAAAGHEIPGGNADNGSSSSSVVSSKSRASRKPSSMFDAVSPLVTAEDNFGTPYSVCRVGRDNRAVPTVVKPGGDNNTLKEHAQGRVVQHRGGTGETASSGGCDDHDDESSLCHTPLKPVGRTCAAATASASASAHSSGNSTWWMECATPPALPVVGTPCSGSRFRCSEDEESDYSDYETVREMGWGRVIFFVSTLLRETGRTAGRASTKLRFLFVCRLPRLRASLFKPLKTLFYFIRQATSFAFV